MNVCFFFFCFVFYSFFRSLFHNTVNDTTTEHRDVINTTSTLIRLRMSRRRTRAWCTVLDEPSPQTGAPDRVRVTLFPLDPCSVGMDSQEAIATVTFSRERKWLIARRASDGRDGDEREIYAERVWVHYDTRRINGECQSRPGPCFGPFVRRLKFGPRRPVSRDVRRPATSSRRRFRRISTTVVTDFV